MKLGDRVSAKSSGHVPSTVLGLRHLLAIVEPDVHRGLGTVGAFFLGLRPRVHGDVDIEEETVLVLVGQTEGGFVQNPVREGLGADSIPGAFHNVILPHVGEYVTGLLGLLESLPGRILGVCNVAEDEISISLFEAQTQSVLRRRSEILK